MERSCFWVNSLIILKQNIYRGSKYFRRIFHNHLPFIKDVLVYIVKFCTSSRNSSLKWAKERNMGNRVRRNPLLSEGKELGKKHDQVNWTEPSINIIQNCSGFPRVLSCFIAQVKYLLCLISVFPHYLFPCWCSPVNLLTEFSLL